MGYGILWLGILAAFLLLNALVIALASHSGMRWVRLYLPALSGILYLPIATAAVLTGVLYFEDIGPRWTFWYGLSLAISALIGFVVIERKGMKYPPGGEEPTKMSRQQTIRRRLGGLGMKEAKVPDWSRLKLGAAFLVVSFVTVSTYLHMDNSAMEEIARFRTETTTQLQQMMPARAPDDRNARLVYEQASKALGAGKDLPKWLEQIPSDISRNDLTEFVEKNKSTLDLVNRAAALPNWVYDVDMTKPAYEWPIPQFSSYRQLSYLLYHSASLKADAGDTAGALKELAVIEAMSNHFRTVPSLISAMISYNIDHRRVQGLEYTLSRLSDRALPRISPVKAHGKALDVIYRALQFESVMTSQSFTFIVTKGAEDTPPWTMSFYRVFLLGGDMRAEQAQNAVMAKPVRTYEELNGNNKEAIQAAKSAGGVLKQLLAGYPDYTHYIYRTMAYEARQGLADLALAMTACKSAKGHYPEKIEELAPDYIDRIPTDPFDGKPLKAKPVQGGLELYSTATHPDINSPNREPINFYLGKEAYEEFRVKPAREKRQKAEALNKKTSDAKK